jgi:hypothetical protein
MPGTPIELAPGGALRGRTKYENKYRTSQLRVNLLLCAMKMTVPTLSGPEEVRGRKYGPFLVHRSVSTDPGFWTVTHVGCGLAFPFGFETSANAVAFAKEVEEVMDWDQIKVAPQLDPLTGKGAYVSGAPTAEQAAAVHDLARKYWA